MKSHLQCCQTIFASLLMAFEELLTVSRMQAGETGQSCLAFCIGGKSLGLCETSLQVGTVTGSLSILLQGCWNATGRQSQVMSRQDPSGVLHWQSNVLNLTRLPH